MTRQGTPIGDKPRPRVVLVGLSGNEDEELAQFFTDPIVLNKLTELPSAAHWTEVDLIISAADDGATWDDKPEFRDYSTKCHLILAGDKSWSYMTVPPYVPDST